MSRIYCFNLTSCSRWVLNRLQRQQLETNSYWLHLKQQIPLFYFQGFSGRDQTRVIGSPIISSILTASVLVFNVAGLRFSVVPIKLIKDQNICNPAVRDALKLPSVLYPPCGCTTTHKLRLNWRSVRISFPQKPDLWLFHLFRKPSQSLFRLSTLFQSFRRVAHSQRALAAGISIASVSQIRSYCLLALIFPL